MTRTITYPTSISVNIEGKTITGKEIVEIKINYDPDNIFIIGMNPQAAEEFIKEIKRSIDSFSPKTVEEPTA